MSRVSSALKFFLLCKKKISKPFCPAVHHRYWFYALNSDEFADLIGKELRRQIKLLVDNNSSVDGKIGIFLGFQFLVFIQVVLLGAFVFTLSSPDLVAYAAGLVLIVISIMVGLYAYFKRALRDYPVGVDIRRMLISYENGEGGDYKSDIQNSMLLAARELKIMTVTKMKLLRAAAGFFAAGIIVLTILAFISIYGMAR